MKLNINNDKLSLASLHKLVTISACSITLTLACISQTAEEVAAIKMHKTRLRYCDQSWGRLVLIKTSSV